MRSADIFVHVDIHVFSQVSRICGSDILRLI